MKKTTINNTTTNENNNNDAISLIKQSITNARESYKDFIAGGVYILLHDAGGRDSLRDIVKREYASESEWQAVKRQYNRKIDACMTLYEHRHGILEKMDVQAIREWLAQNNMTQATIDDIKNKHANLKDKKTTPSPVKTTTPQKASESAESDDEKSDVQKAWEAISDLTPSEWEELAKLADSQGYFFKFGKKPVKQESDLYGCKKAING